MDRTVATGTGFTWQYPKPVMEQYEPLETTPDQLLLFFHHVPYTHVLHSGKTVIQSIYDMHYEGAAVAAGFVQSWESLKGLIDDERFALTDSLLQYQVGHAMVWRDAVTNYFLKKYGDGQPSRRRFRRPSSRV
jgi:alpha-glucuronidase